MKILEVRRCAINTTVFYFPSITTAFGLFSFQFPRSEVLKEMPRLRQHPTIQHGTARATNKLA